jgi:hypothetical protein
MVLKYPTLTLIKYEVIYIHNKDKQFNDSTVYYFGIIL